MKEHLDRANERANDLSQTAQRVAEVGLETASKAATYVRGGVDRAADYAQELSGAASEKITDVTGRPPDEWARQLRQFVEQSPIKALVVAIAAGFLVGRVIRHG
jgi:ElaB/YqjD/DUF883 family membrane-anchored ribosome-binding protein